MRGEWIEATARLEDDPGAIREGFDCIVAKYGWQMRLALLTSRLSGRYADRAILELRPVSRAPLLNAAASL